MCWLLWNSHDLTVTDLLIIPTVQMRKLRPGILLTQDREARKWRLRFKQEPGLLTLLLLTHVSLKHQSNIQCESHLSLFLSHTHIALLLKYGISPNTSWFMSAGENEQASFKLGKEAQELTMALDHCAWLVWAYICSYSDADKTMGFSCDAWIWLSLILS